MTALLAELHEDQATGRIAEIYDEIRRFSGVPYVSSLQRYLATMPGVLEWAWESIRPAMVSGAIPEMGWALARSVRVTPAAPIPAAALQGVDIAQVRNVATNFVRVSPVNLMTGACLARLLTEAAPHGAGFPGGWTPPAMLPPMPGNVDPAAIDPAVRACFMTEVDGKPFVPALYRQLAHWPSVLAWLAGELGPRFAAAETAAARASFRAAARAAAPPIVDLLPGLPAGPVPDADTTRRILATIDRYAETSPEMTMFGQLILDAIPPGSPCRPAGIADHGAGFRCGSGQDSVGMPVAVASVMDTHIARPDLAPLSPHHTLLRCVFLLALHRGIQLPPEQLAMIDVMEVVPSVLLRRGLHAELRRHGRWTDLHRDCPAMARYRDGHWVVLLRVHEHSVHLLDPRAEQDGVIVQSRAAFLRDWSRTCVVCPEDETSVEPFGLRWFLPDLIRQAGLLRDVAVAALMSSLIAFAMPLLFQIMIDKVIVHHGTQTLLALMVVFATLTLFDGLFTYARHVLMTVVTSKTDARLASRVFQHLLSLPMAFFEATTAGVLTRNLQQTDTIRQFLTGRLFQTALDALTLPLLLGILLLYSVRLTLIVLAFSSLMALLIGIMVPGFRRRLEILYQAEGARQTLLIETIHGMRTVKSLGLEPERQRLWNEAVTNGARRRAMVGRIAAGASVLTQVLEKSMQMTVLGVGALEVFSGGLSIGALVAFNMIAGRVTGPLVQIVGLISEYQETTLAVRMLGRVMQHKPEYDSSRVGMTTPVRGALEFDAVSFRYPGQTTPALDRVSFCVREGQIVGVVGRSGSGKTTLTRLIQGILEQTEGTIRLDGTDIRNLDLAHLRRGTGVVLQENFLFRSTIKNNIAVALPGAPFADVVAAAQMAGADSFIERLPHGYDTLIEENGSNFSGGQRQRLAIARALLPNPRLLIFDEATSALDPESEAAVQNNLAAIAAGRTLVIVSHRLTSLTTADAILVLDEGRVLDFAPHTVLLTRCEMYQRLWHQQTRHFA